MVTMAGLAPAFSYLQNRNLDYFELTVSVVKLVEMRGNAPRPAVCKTDMLTFNTTSPEIGGTPYSQV